MKIRLQRPVMIGETKYDEGTILDLPRGIAAALVSADVAEAVEPERAVSDAIETRGVA